MKFLVMSVAAASLVVSGSAFGEQSQPKPSPQPSQPPTQQQQEEQARAQAVNAYAQILFAREIEERCEHLGEEKQAKFDDDVATVDSYMQENLSEEIVKAVQKKTATAGADEEKNPCGNESKQFVEQSAVMTAQISDNIRKAGEEAGE